MASYDKPKRKNAPLPQISVWNLIASFASGLFHYGLVAPTRWTWRQGTRLFKWSWRQTKRFFFWTWRQSGALLSWGWHSVSLILQKTVFAPFITLGRLLGFVANAIPDGLSPIEVEAYQRINRQFRRQKRWYLHVLTFLIGMASLWSSELLSNQSYPQIGLGVMMTIIWFVILGGHRLWMNLGESEDREIGEALHRIRNPQQAIYYEEEFYEQQPDSSRLEDGNEDQAEWLDEELIHKTFKAKRQSN